MKKQWEKILFCSLIVTLAAQFNINFFITNFKISIAVILFFVFFFLVDSFSVIPIVWCSAIGIFVSRVLHYWFKYDSLSGIGALYLPEMAFYITYGILFFLYIRLLSGGRPDKNRAMIPLILIDYGANLSELLLRIQADAFGLKAQIGILLVACLRAAIIWCVLTIFEHYRFLLLKQEHEDRYKRLVLLISKLDGEMVWMKKNTSLIEDTMNTSYRLSEQLKDSDASPDLASLALHVAKDIHEVKKEYLLIMRGISESLDQELKSDGLYLEDLILLLKDALHRDAKEQGKELRFIYHVHDNPYINRHYALMSIFRNLFVNALEASQRDIVTLTITQTKQDGCYRFMITDDGPGIPAGHQEDVFKAGFSTKINYDTGTINRGLGLSLVSDLVKETFCGTLSLTSRPGETTFTLMIPIAELEVPFR